MKRTNICYSKNDPMLPLKRSTKVPKAKYQRIMEHSLDRLRSGSTLTIQSRSEIGRVIVTKMIVNDNPFERKYFVDYNEIYDRPFSKLLLVASEFAGNNEHNTEISLNIKELNEAHIMK